ncbi:IAA-alanine resistance protein 1 [Dendrobium catenatum]|uniref:IAA-alanine resistance protein 1 n=1 Tax=Dendrobium catenatum TaxID=906689 RepID=UPI00109FA116|nr:IAA-alanine resistance protein 1 [Dendrobium catenatum]
MALLAIPARRSLPCGHLLLVATWAVVVLCVATEKASPSCRFSSPAFSDDQHHHAHHDHDHHHHHPHEHDHDHDHDHGEIQSRKLPEELAEEEDLAREGFGFNHHHHHHRNHHHYHRHFHSNDGSEHEISRLGIWVRAMGCSLLVSMASLICLIILPLIFFQGKPSRAVVDCLAVFGAGAMLGDAFLHQLPHAFGGKHSHSHDNHIDSFGEADHEHGHSHAHSLEDLSVGLSMLLGIVLFFLVEKIVRYVEDHSPNGANNLMHGHNHHHHKQQQKLKHDGEVTSQQLSDSKNRETVDMISETELNGQSDARLKNDKNDKWENLRKRTTFDGVASEDEKDVDSRNVQGIQKQPSLNEIVPVHTSSNLVFGYLNLFSDGVHNFTDGMALGSAFLLHGTVGGWSRTLFLLAHELPQEVGDFGILVRSGFSISKALFFNFLSALVALAGTALALVLGKDPGQSSLIEGFTAGGFIYIAVAGVLPEMHDGKTTIRSTGIQLTSLLAGMAVALCISLVE